MDDELASATACYDRYLDAVNERDDARRREILGECATDSLTIVSPAYLVRGREEASAKLGEVMAALATPVTMRRAGALDLHHDRFRAAFEAVDARGSAEGGAVVTTGLHVGRLVGGRLDELVVFVPRDLRPEPGEGSEREAT